MSKMFDESGDFECPQNGPFRETLEKGVVAAGIAALGIDAVATVVRKRVGNSLSELIATLTGEKPKF